MLLWGGGITITKELEIFSPDILNDNLNANIIITSVLYHKQIKKDLLNNKKFNGKIYELN